MNTETDGQRIKRIREYMGLTQTDLGAKLGVSATTIYRWEVGDRKPHRIFLRELDRLHLEWAKQTK